MGRRHVLRHRACRCDGGDRRGATRHRGGSLGGYWRGARCRVGDEITQEDETLSYNILQGDCRIMLALYPDNHFDSAVIDAPYGLSKEPDMAEVLRHWL